MVKHDLLKEWRESSEQLYDRLDTIRLEWTSLTCQWELSKTAKPEAYISTFTVREAPEFVRKVVVDTEKYSPPEHVLTEYVVSGSEDKQAYPQAESLGVTRLAQSPHDSETFVALTDFGEVYVYNKQTTTPVKILNGNQSTGFGLAWNPTKPGEFVTGTEDGKLILWKDNELLREIQLDEMINEVTWDHENRIVLALDSGKVVILNSEFEEQYNMKLHDKGINCASLSPFSPHLLATGDESGVLRVFDTRLPLHENMLYENSVHEKQLTCVKWSPHIDGVLATAGMDCLVYLWDLRKIGVESGEFMEEGLPEMILKHLGHLDAGQVNALDWHPHIPMYLLTNDEKGNLMAWQPAAGLYKEQKAPKLPSFLI